MIRSLVWLLPADGHAPGRARAAVELLGGFGPRRHEALALLVSELVTNSVRHAGLSPEDEIRLVVRCGTALHVDVVDHGSGFAAGADVRALGERRDHGLGFVARLSSRWGAELMQPTRVWFELDGDT